MKYSIIYITLRPAIEERISVGIAFINGDNVSYRISDEKLEKAKNLFYPKIFSFLSKTLHNLESHIKDRTLFEYTMRYSNNLITFGCVDEIEIEDTEENRTWLFENYVYSEEIGH